MAKLVFGKPKSSPVKLRKCDLTKVTAFSEKQTYDKDGYIYLNVKNQPFALGGVLNPNDNYGEYYRLDASKKEIYSDANRGLAECTSGGSVRFATDAAEISLRATLRGALVGMMHFANRGVYGFDIYIGTGTNRKYCSAPMQFLTGDPNFHQDVIQLGAGVKEVQINFPLYGGVKDIEIGFPKKSRVGTPTPRTNGAVAFYGSSITQGGCVSRPANSYAMIICRALDADCCNYGFSGSGLGELAVAEHIATRDLACFVMDYDFNAPTLEHLQATHEPFFKLFREKQPNTPVVFVVHPYYGTPTQEDKARRDLVYTTYQNAINAGDENVYFVDSTPFFPTEMNDLYTVDYLHPNDLGQMYMARAIFPAVKKAIDSKK